MVNRRDLLAGLGAIPLAGLALAGCDTAPQGAGGSRSGTLRWWDHTPNLQRANQQLFDAYQAAGGLTVDYTYQQAGKIGQALQLAKQSDQLPDVLTNAGLELPMDQLIAQGWFSPMPLSDAAKAVIGPENLIEGIHVFDGEVYSFPVFNPRWYGAANWFNTELMTRAGLDPAAPPTTYDEFRAALTTVAGAVEGSQGLVLNAGMPARMESQINNLAQSAGFEGNGGISYTTGEFGYDTEPYLQVMEFLASLITDRLIMAGSVGFDDKVARQRWATGVAPFFWDGPWCCGSASQDAAPFVEKIGFGPQLVPQAGRRAVTYAGAPGGLFFLGGGSAVVEESVKLMEAMATTDYQQAISGAMAQPPLDLSQVATSQAVPEFKKSVEVYAENCFVGPTPVAGNPEVSKVNQALVPVKPNLGVIFQGMLSGDVTDWRAALSTLRSASEQAREDAIAKATAGGATVSVDDWVFPNWTADQDFTADMY